ncbi:MAG: AI-2 transport protein TqsA [Alphaproteobacteria bacterium MarineAlpha5_Bin8]|nr:MAG: AI-2 transport protein TqsA [Alphaproteobacteria bacterium MarineAlpha5_Bin7]PPR46291.1 MAG: AI-2 transport protein TqsA [Alphaproteobacteria bacterium MarineAlpha5_Bin8]PPR54234.1 MAG: AI-2 transport protein TqsA [Alphaproteobacteria bacterium MarineAlpha5_Bin6]|tara:strand:+ start:73 stop:1083 length:1011 start_codon:yes stop_codon:yes gene_type:complete
MIENSENSKLITFSLFIIALVAFAFALNFTKPIMIPFVLALLIRILIDPIIDFQIKNLRVHRIVAVFVSLLLIVFLFIIIVPFIVGSVATFLGSADDYNTKVLLLLDIIISELQKFEIQINREVIRDSFLSLPFLDWASAILSNSANIISKFFLVVIITLFLLLGRKSKETSKEWDQIIDNVKKYIFTKFITSTATGILTGLIYWFLGLELALIFGTMTFLLNFIPVLGSVIAVIIPLPVALLQYSDPTFIVYVILFPTIVHIIIGNIIEPKIFGEAFGLHPITIILSLIFWGMIWGMMGVLLAAPITAIIKIAFEKFQATLPFAKLLEGNIHHKV